MHVQGNRADRFDGKDAVRCYGTGRGRSARRPDEIPGRGWRDILLRVWQKIGDDHASLVAAGIALNALLAVFPALAVAVSIYGMFSSPAAVAGDLKPFIDILPPAAGTLLLNQLQSLVVPAHAKLGLGAILSALIAFWSARQASVALMTATNIAYYEHEKRGFFTQIAISLVFTIAGVVAFLFVLVLGVAVPLVLQLLPLGPTAAAAILVLRWVLLWFCAIFTLSAIYRYAPDRQAAQWQWVTWGSVIAATLWLLGSVLFALYVNHFNSYNATYGALGGVIVLIMWFYLGGFVVVLGAEVNAEMEHQTAVDTTEGPPAPMGERGAYVADTLGKIPD
ncbi:MAG TPA: YihY/virulence factor BrkB family protein [Steroidobacteraceae bacterium]